MQTAIQILRSLRQANIFTADQVADALDAVSIKVQR
jgi:hypothetical protein